MGCPELGRSTTTLSACFFMPCRLHLYHLASVNMLRTGQCKAGGVWKWGNGTWMYMVYRGFMGNMMINHDERWTINFLGQPYFYLVCKALLCESLWVWPWMTLACYRMTSTWAWQHVLHEVCPRKRGGFVPKNRVAQKQRWVICFTYGVPSFSHRFPCPEPGVWCLLICWPHMWVTWSAAFDAPNLFELLDLPQVGFVCIDVQQLYIYTLHVCGNFDI